MSLDQVKMGGDNLESQVPPDSPQPLELTTTPAASSKASSRCSTPSSDQNGSAEEEESMTTLNLTINKSLKDESSFLPELSSKSRPSNGDAHDLTMRIPSGNKMLKSDVLGRSAKSSRLLPSLNTSSPLETLPNSPDFSQLLLEYRTVLLDTLTKAILQSSGEDVNNEKGVVLPVKCQCGFTSELSKQITRTSTYVHQLELRFRALLEKTSHESKYTPRRPWFITAAQQVPGTFPFAASTPVSSKLSHASLLEKSKRMRSAAPAPVDLKSVSLYSGNSSITSSLNGDEEDVDSEEDDVNGDNLPLPTVVSAVAAASAGNLMTANGTMNEPNGANGVSSAAGGKTILEGYLESVRSANVMPVGMASEDGSDDDDKDEDDLDGPGKRIDPKTKKQVLQMHRSGASISDISRAISISRKSVRRIISNYRAYESRLQKNLQDSILKLYSQGRSYTQIARSTGVSKPTIAKIIKQYIDSNIFTKGPTNGLMQNGVTPAAANLPVPNDHFDDDDDDEEREMVVDEDAADDDDDLEDEEDNINDEASAKNVIDGNVPSFSMLSNKLSLKSSKHQRNTSLLYNAFDGSHQQAKQALGNGTSMHGGRMSLIKQSERYKPYEAKLRNPVNHEMLGHQRIPKHGHPIVPPLPASANLYSGIRSSGLKVHTNGNVDSSTVRIKGTKPRHSQDGLLVPEADKNNNTTLNSCNLSISSSGATNGKSPEEVSAPPGQLPPIPASLIEGNGDSEANLVPKNFIENFPAGISKIVNSLNPNRATKLTLEDFNIVWQLRSQHWTHNQIRKYFQQRGKSISKSSISRIMNGKQRNFQQFFNVVPSSY